MPATRYFHDTPAGAVELTRPRGMDRKEADKLWPGMTFKRWDSFAVWIGGTAEPATADRLAAEGWIDP